MTGEQRTLTTGERDRIAAQAIAERRGQRPLAETPVGQRILALIAAQPMDAEAVAFHLDQLPHEADVLLRELAVRGLARRTPEGWAA